MAPDGRTNICREVLDFWHKVEFFIPFDLEEQVFEDRDAEWSVRPISAAQLNALAPDSHGNLWVLARPPEGKELSGFKLFFGVFDKSQIANVTRQVLAEDLSTDEQIEQEERTELEGRTCFARLMLNQFGELIPTEVSVSTVPWALGQVSNEGLSALAFDRFEASIETLKAELKDFVAKRRAPPEATQMPLTRRDLDELYELFVRWAGFRPDSDMVMVIQSRVRAKKDVRPKGAAPEQTAVENCAALNSSSEAPETGQTEAEDSDEDASVGDDEELEIDILNSFFAGDIERILTSLDDSGLGSPLQNYLAPRIADSERIDLYSSTGRSRIAKGLEIMRTPRAHWLDEPAHVMSLMQQFAINTSFEHLARDGMYSVNGPPGTGKTTLLRDVIAENITRRAKVLAGYQSAQEAFQTGAKLKVEFADSEKPQFMAKLKDELTGFEMVVASANNAAVENISQDLPKTAALGKYDSEKQQEGPWRHADGTAKQTYLQQVSHKYAAQNKDGSFRSLPVDEVPWGLVSCALGNSKNRRRFARIGSSSAPRGNGPSPKGFSKDLHQSIWEWRDRYQGPTFAQARDKFNAAHKAVDTRRREYADYASLAARLRGHTADTYTKAERSALAAAISAHDTRTAALENLTSDLATTRGTLEDLRELESLIRAPSWFAKLFRTRDYKRYQAEVEENHSARRMGLSRKMELEKAEPVLKKAADEASIATQEAHEALIRRQDQWARESHLLRQLSEKFPQAKLLTTTDDLENTDWQRDGLWPDQELNDLRSKLFSAALTLHEAWLREVLLTGGGFGANVVTILRYLEGSLLANREHALPIWQSLFLLVPVVSTTFASVGRQFRDLGRESLGWLFIDEAGQAVPQAAVGALWRARRAVVVGDPLQIEPVFTVPIKLIEALARSSDLPDTDLYLLPHKSSVQNRADMANPLGAWIKGVDGSQQWIGTPLRVHRRCVDPMFSVSNGIAYEGKMVYGLPTRRPPENGLDLGDSAWVDIAGEARNKQVVQTQVELVFECLVALYQRTGQLPSLYIISPFKKVKAELQALLRNRSRWDASLDMHTPAPSKSKLDEWCRKRIGTVHTFQGKEESVVWMVLGCDDRTSGAVAWACKKPNILNVALTRAKHRFFFLGDARLWGGRPFFNQASPHLFPRITDDEFRLRCRA